jgi:SAM-dependent methyltransferase
MSTLRELLKRNESIRNFGKYFRRTILNSKYCYFLSTSTKPLSNQYGFDRGIPLDRFFIEDFLKNHSADIKGVCLEVLSNDYTVKYGGEKVSQSDVLDIEATNQNANIIDDLRQLQKISDSTYDTIILTQVLQFIDHVEAAISECHRILKPGGVLLVTLPCLSRADCISGTAGDFWRFTQAGAKYLFAKKFNSENLIIDFYGNARSGLYFYAGLSIADTPRQVLQDKDANFPTIITVRAVKV